MPSLPANLAEALGTIQSPGDFSTGGTAEILSPRLEVEGVGPIALPFLPVQAEQLIATAERAPYGRGGETFTDTQVRRTWQIAPGRVHIGGRHWPETLEAILARVNDGLGVTGPVEAELYKLLIYDEGSFFTRHRDTEKVPGMFGTLIVALPSVSAGGELIVRHRDREARFDLRCEDPSEIAFAAFYADCVHEVLPVTAGYRMALVYNLVRPGRGQRPEPPDHTPQEDVVAGLLKAWAMAPRSPEYNMPEKLVYLLEHAYTPAELSFQALKGADAGTAKVVVAAAARSACEVHLALVTIEESGSAEYAGYSRSRRSRSRYDNGDDDDDDDFEAGEIYERSVTASEWRRPDGEPSPLTVIPIEDEEFSPPEAFEDVEPDEQHFREATGNEGASFDRTYSRAALVLWPRARLLAVINQAGLPVTLPFLADLAERWAASGADHDSPLWRQAHELSAHMIADWPMSNWHPRMDGTSTGEMLALLTRLRDVAHLDAFLTAIATRGGFDHGDSPAIADALRVLPSARAASLLRDIVAGAAGKTLPACAGLLARAASLGHAVVADAAQVLTGALASERPREAWHRRPEVEPGFVVDLFSALTRIDAGLADQAATDLLSLPKLYDLDAILVPAMRDLIGAPETAGSGAVRRLRLACVAHLEARVAQQLEAPRDWGRPSAVACACVHCAELSRFLADPVNARWVFRANQAERNHVEGTVRTSQCDVDTTTETRGRPYSLICTKNQASYERRRRQRETDLADLERLRV